ncbi:MAG: hypothetical protein IJ434_00440 [Alistipes sp.]|nr:hypothetical protein [Alistipes sp.]
MYSLKRVWVRLSACFCITSNVARRSCRKLAAICLVPEYIRWFLNALCRREHRHEHKE